MNPLLQCKTLGQSIWLDFIRRRLLADGELARLVAEDGVSGVTSNPAIFEKAIGGSDDYDAALAAAIDGGERDPGRLFEGLAIEDIRATADVLAPVHRDSGGADGYVSLEVSPHLAMDEEATVRDAVRLWRAVARQNLMIKVPGTAAGIGALRRLTAQGINVNVTLLFARSAYRSVAQAYIDGVEAFAAGGGDPSKLASVASFFVSRIDSALDAEIERRAATATAAEAAALRALSGRIAIANAKLAYEDAARIYAQPRWGALVQRGARVQRLLWASTGTKNPAYSDVLYMETLIGPDTVNTVPPATMDAFRDHGRARASLTENVDEAHAVFAEIERLQLPLDSVTEQLVGDGIKLFADAHDKLLAAVAGKRDALLQRVGAAH